ncbi:MAG: NADH-quinone oxidoreductase subunit NuoH [Armatimonadota bacterium]|nr:NADH-quinone oxidoreductase subunit NuoH [Armatimonadota bacterium]MDR7443442.1 NADH-quinone oxidoreductase subunit NuoH [Armatimonadota bacterium]MDR7569281.1 NADH-quinone oxidoreductase subunit NuoH [Armatimonadota bacterium]MDR7614941.1 NADH-quinone oxidoreductase subunit NuoH [Armatimonadota bacterium]
MAEAIRMVLSVVIVFTFVAVGVALFLVLMERKVSAWVQARIGPRHVGPYGTLQTLADLLKLLQKEHILPAGADRLMFGVAPVVVAVAALMSYVVLPWGPGVIVRDLGVGVLYFAAVLSLEVVGILTAGWASNNKYALLGGLRSAAQMVSYELPLGFSILTVATIAGTLSTVRIVEAQPYPWYTYPSVLLAGLVFLVAATAESNRIPFDLPEAESELVAGYFSEYSPLRFALFQLGEYGSLFATSALFVTLFLGGWRGPFEIPLVGPVVDGIFWFLLKTYAVVFFFMWVRWTYPRFRIDQLLNVSWKLLLPLSLANLLLAGLLVTWSG